MTGQIGLRFLFLNNLLFLVIASQNTWCGGPLSCWKSLQVPFKPSELLKSWPLNNTELMHWTPERPKNHVHSGSPRCHV